MFETLMALLVSPQAWAAFLTLTALEIVLGIDNLVVLAILASRLPQQQQALARKLGLAAALVTRVLLLSMLFWISHLEKPVFSAIGREFSWADIMLIAGGIFLLYKGTKEIHEKVESGESEHVKAGSNAFMIVIMQIAIIDIVFSFDSVITAIGVAEDLIIMIAAVVIAMIVMIFSIDWVGDFIERHPTVKILALSFVLLIGMVLVAEGFSYHIPRGYLYFAMAFSFGIEALNMRMRVNEKRKVK